MAPLAAIMVAVAISLTWTIAGWALERKAKIAAVTVSV
jgi:hypothetical protein